MAFDGEIRMTTLSQAIGRAALLKARFASIEAGLQDAYTAATAGGRPDIAVKLGAALEHVQRGHARAGEAAGLVAAHFDVPVSDVGGEDKPPPGGG